MSVLNIICLPLIDKTLVLKRNNFVIEIRRERIFLVCVKFGETKKSQGRSHANERTPPTLGMVFEIGNATHPCSESVTLVCKNDKHEVWRRWSTAGPSQQQHTQACRATHPGRIRVIFTQENVITLHQRTNTQRFVH